MEEENQATPEKDIPLSKSGRLVVAGRYHPGDELGKGAFSRVFRALDVVTGSLVAIKQVDILPLSARDKERIRQELDLLTRLIHPNIVSLIDFEETEEYFNFILEYIEGGSLHSLKGKYGNIPEPLLSYFMFQTLKGLQYLHSFKIMHRDIKGANILLTKSGECKLADFGSCSDSFGDRQITMIGTPYWMAPELISQTGGGPASDIWSLGCTILELFTGQPPYWKLNSNLALYRMVEDPHPPLPSNCSEDLQEFLFNCFLKDEKMRYTATELLQHPWIVQHSNFDRTQKRILPKMFPELVLSPPATLPEQKEKKPEKKHKKLTAFGKKKDKNKEHESEAHEKLQRSKTGEMVSSRRMTTPSHEVHTRSDELLLNYVQSVEGGPSTARRRGALPTEELRHTAEPSSESPTSPHSSRGPSRSPPPSSSPSTSPTLANVSTDLDIPTSSDFKDADNEHSEKSILVEMEEELNLEIKELRTGLKQWKKKMTKLVPDKINLELQRDAFQTETQMLFRRKEDLVFFFFGFIFEKIILKDFCFLLKNLFC